MDDQFTDLQRLLRLKRHEAPPPAYFEDFMVEFHRRQRAELLKRPIWRLALDRIEGALPTITFARYAYAGGCTAAVLAAGIVSARILATPVAAPSNFHTPAGLAAVSTSPRINIYSSHPSTKLAPELDFDRPRPVAAAASATQRPRYVLDTQPVRYVQASSF